MAPGDQVVEEIRDEVEGEVQVVIEEIGADDLAVREVIDLEEEDDVADDAPMVAQVDQEAEDEEAVGVADEGTHEEIIFEDAVGQIGVEPIDEEGHLEEQADVVDEFYPQDGPALSDTIDLTDSPRPNRLLEYQTAVRRCMFDVSLVQHSTTQYSLVHPVNRHHPGSSGQPHHRGHLGQWSPWSTWSS